MGFRKCKVFKVICFSLIFSFLSSSLTQAASLNLTPYNQLIPLSSAYSFPLLKGLKFDPANPLKMEFIIDTADKKDVSEEEASTLIKYFLAGLTTPEEDIWVNLSPYEEERIITEGLSQTDLGKDLLSQDYLLKQLTSSLTYPESNTGKDYWEKTYKEVMKIAKTTKLPVSTFNKVWIVPDEAEVYETDNAGLITKAKLKVMLEEDYVALKNKQETPDFQKESQKYKMNQDLVADVNQAASKVMKEAILPKINQEVNSGKNFAQLRQIYYSLILGLWFKQKFQDTIYQHYINQGKIKGIDLEDKSVREKIYQQYIQAFKTGLYNYIRTDEEPATHKKLKRRYYSGGFIFKTVDPNGNSLIKRVVMPIRGSDGIVASRGFPGYLDINSAINGGGKNIEVEFGNPSQDNRFSERLQNALVPTANSPLTSDSKDIPSLLRSAINGDGTAYKKIKEIPRQDLISHFEENLTGAMDRIPEDLFGGGFGYDIRGNAQPLKGGEVNLTPENVYLIGKVLGSRYAKEGEKVLITGDLRHHTPILRLSLALGYASVGVNVDFSEEILTTGAHNVYSAENPKKYKHQTQITGSHGVPEKNGLKIKVDFGQGLLEPLYAEELVNLYKNRRQTRKVEQAGVISEIGGIQEAVVEMYDKTLPQFTKSEILVIDVRAGAAGQFIEGFFSKRGFTIVDIDTLADQKIDLIGHLSQVWTSSGNKQLVVLLNGRPDPAMGRGIWDPSNPKALKDAQVLVKKINESFSSELEMPKAIGAVYDADADRFTGILENGEAVPAFEMTLPFYQRFLLHPKVKRAIQKIVELNGHPLWLSLDVRSNDKLTKLLERINEWYKREGDLSKDYIQEWYINTGYPPQLDFVKWRIGEMDEFIDDTLELKNVPDFMKNYEYLKRHYFTAEASGHTYFQAAPGNPYRPCDDGLAAFSVLVHIRETIGEIEALPLGMGEKEDYELTELFEKFPPAFSTQEIRTPISNTIKIATAKKIGQWLKERYANELMPNSFVEPLKVGNLLLQPKGDGFVTVAGFKAQLTEGRSALVRWSNTGEELSLMFTGPDWKSLIEITQEVTDQVKKEGVDTTNLEKEIQRLKDVSASSAITSYHLSAKEVKENQGAAIRAMLEKMGEDKRAEVFFYNRQTGKFQGVKKPKKEIEKLLLRDEIGVLEIKGRPGEYRLAMKEGGAVVTEDGELLISTRTTFPTFKEVPYGRRTHHYFSKFLPKANQFFKFYGEDGEFDWINDVLGESKVIIVKPGHLGEQAYAIDSQTKTIKIDEAFLKELTAYAQQRVFYGLLAGAAFRIKYGEVDFAKEQELIERIAQKSLLTGHNRLEDSLFIYNLKNTLRREHQKLTNEEVRRFLSDRLERIDFLNGRLAWMKLVEAFGWAGDLPEESLREILDNIFQKHPNEIMADKPAEEKLRDKFADQDNLYFPNLQYLADQALKEKKVVQVVAITARDSGLFGNKVATYSELQFAPYWPTEVGFATNANEFRNSLIVITLGLDEKLREIEARLFETIRVDPGKWAEAIERASQEFKSELSWERFREGRLNIGKDLIKEIKENLQLTADIRRMPFLLLIMAERSSAVGEDDPRRAFPGQGSSDLFVWAIDAILKALGFEVGKLEKVKRLMNELNAIDVKEEQDKFSAKQKELQGALNEVLPEVAKALGFNLPQGLSITGAQSVTPWYELLELIISSLKNKIESGEIKFTQENLDNILVDVYIRSWLYVQASLFNQQAINYRLLKKMSVYAKRYDEAKDIIEGELVKMSTFFLPMVFNDQGWLTLGLNQSTGAHQMVTTTNPGLTNSLVSGDATGERIDSNYDGEIRRQVVPPGGNILWEVPNPILGGTIKINPHEDLKGFPIITDLDKIQELTQAQAALGDFFEAPIDAEGGFLSKRDAKGQLIPQRDERGNIKRDRLGNIIYEEVIGIFQLRSESVRRWENPFIVIQHFLRLREEDAETLTQQKRTIADGVAATWGVMHGEIGWIEKDTKLEDLDGKIAVAWDTGPSMEHLLVQQKDETGKVVKGIKGLITIIGSKSTHGYLYCVEQVIPYIGGIGKAATDNLWGGRRIIGDPMYKDGGVVFDAEDLVEGKDFHIETSGADFDVRNLPPPAALNNFRLGLNLDHGGSAQMAGGLRRWSGYYGIGLKRNERLLRQLGGVAEGFLRYSNYLLYSLMERFDRGEKLSEFEYYQLEKILERELRYAQMSWQEQMDYIRKKQEPIVSVKLVISPGRVEVVQGAKKTTYTSTKELFEREIRKQRINRSTDSTANDAYNPDLPQDKKEIDYFINLTKGYLDGKDYFMRTLIPWFKEFYDEIKAESWFIRLMAEGIEDSKMRDEILKIIDQYISNSQLYPLRYAKMIEELVGKQGSQLSAPDKEKVQEVIGLLGMMTYERLDDRSADKVWGVPGSRVISPGRNPFMDYRGLFLFIDNPVVMEWLLGVFVEVVKDGRFPLGIFTPITNDVLNFLKFREQMFKNGLIPSEVKQGAMAEVPAVATNSRDFLSALPDFWSVGSNDWVMFGLALSRFLQRKGKEHYLGFSPRDTGFIRPLATLINDMKLFNELIRKPLGLTEVTCGSCGNWPAVDPSAAAFLQGLGAGSASVTLNSIEKAAITADNAINRPKELSPKEREDLKRLLEEKDFNIFDHIDDSANPEKISNWHTGSISNFHKELPVHYQALLELDNPSFTLAKDESYETIKARLSIVEDSAKKLEEAIKNFRKTHKETKDISESVATAYRFHEAFGSKEVQSAQSFSEVMKHITKKRQDLSREISALKDKIEISQEKDKLRRYLKEKGYPITDSDGNPVSDRELGEMGRKFYEQELYAYLKDGIQSALKQGIPFVIETPYEAPDQLQYNPDGTKKSMWRFYEDEISDPEMDDRGLRKITMRRDTSGRIQSQALTLAFKAYRRLKEDYPGADLIFSFAFVRGVDEIDTAEDLFFKEGVIEKLESLRKEGKGEEYKDYLEALKNTDEKEEVENIYHALGKKDININSFKKEIFKKFRFGLSVMVPANIFQYPELFAPERHLSDVILNQSDQKVLAQFNLAADWNSLNAKIMRTPLIDNERAAYYTRNEVKLLRTIAERIKGRFLYQPLISQKELQDYQRSLGMIDIPFTLPQDAAKRDEVLNNLNHTADDLLTALKKKIDQAPQDAAEKTIYFNQLDFLKFQTGLIKFVYETKLLLRKTTQDQSGLSNRLDEILSLLKGPIQLTHSLPSSTIKDPGTDQVTSVKQRSSSALAAPSHIKDRTALELQNTDGGTLEGLYKPPQEDKVGGIDLEDIAGRTRIRAGGASSPLPRRETQGLPPLPVIPVDFSRWTGLSFQIVKIEDIEDLEEVFL